MTAGDRSEDDRPKYRQIADDLRADITAGTYQPGDQIPGENALMRRYEVARMTARQALAVLQSEGLTTARKGVGVFVRDFKPIKRRSVERLSRDHWGAGRAIWEADTSGRDLVVDQVKVYETQAPNHVARVLDYLEDDGRVWVRSRRFVLDGKPVLLAVSYLPAAVVAGSQITEPDTGPGGTYARLRDLGYAPAHFAEEVRARMPMTDEAERLALTAGTPVVLVCRTAYTEDGHAVEVNEMTLDAASYVLEYTFDA